MHIRFKGRVLKSILCLVLVALFFGGAFFLLRKWEAISQSSPVDKSVIQAIYEAASRKDHVYLEGREYAPKKNLETLLLLGIDSEGKMESSGTYLNDGKNDFNALLILDKESNTYTILQLNRDTMTPVQCLGIGGAVADTEIMQLALAHTYGSGLDDSCENTVTAVETFLHGIDVDYYFSMNMTAVKQLVDAVGGVTVTIRDDFSAVDPTLVQGETMTLNGEQCLIYIRARRDVGDQTNITRSERQKDFIFQLLSQLDGMEANTEELYTGILDYVQTDLGTYTETMLEKIRDAECAGIVTPEGEALVGEEFMEFYADDDSVWELVIRLFYEPVKE